MSGHRSPIMVVVFVLAFASLSGCVQGQATPITAGAASPTQAADVKSSPTLPPGPTATGATATSGVVQATPTPTSPATLAVRTGPTLTPWPTHTPPPGGTATPPKVTCPGAPALRLVVGMQAEVSQNPPMPSRVRERPGLQGRFIGQIEPGEVVTILDGPRCVDNYAWWKVQSAKGLAGWTVEGDKSDYWLIPKSGQ